MADCKTRSEGVGVFEVIVAVSIITLIAVSIIAAFHFYLRAGLGLTPRVQAIFLAEEGLEVVRHLRDEDWTGNIAPLEMSEVYYPVFATSTGSWTLATVSPGLIEGQFERRITVSDVYRRTADDTIVDVSEPDSKTLDEGTVRVAAEVSWTVGFSRNVLVSYEDGTTDGDLANFPSNDAGDGDAAQSFTTSSGEGAMVGSVSFLLKRVGTPSDTYVEIRSGSTIGAVLATSEGVPSATVSDAQLGWVRYRFEEPPELDAGTEYFLRLRSNPDSTEAFSGSSGTLHIGYRQTASSPYSGGSAWRYVGRQSNPSDTGQELTQYDFSFRANEETEDARTVRTEMYIADLRDN